MATVRELREQLLLSRKALAELSGVSPASIERIEEGPGAVQQENIDKVLEALSKQLKRRLTVHNVDGLKVYNIMRDRRPRPKKVKSEVTS